MSETTHPGPKHVVAGGAAARYRWAVLAVVLLGALVDSLDATILTVILPTVQDDLGDGGGLAQWAIVGYALTFALLLVTGGRAGDVFGRRGVFVAGAVVFGIASAVCGFTTGPELFVAGRLLQGIGAALMVPQAVSVIVLIFPQRQWPAAFGIFGGVLSIGSVCGPLVGGLLTSADVFGLGWRATFLINLPICVVAVVAGLLLLPGPGGAPVTRLDLRGVLLSGLAAFAVMFPLIQGEELGWPWWIWGMLVAAVPLGMLFWRSQQQRQRADGSALVPPELFRSDVFRLGLTLTFLIYLAVTSLFLIFTYAVQTGLGWTPLHTALVTAAWPIGIVTTFQLGWRLGQGREVLFTAIGAAIMAAGAALFAGLSVGLGAGLSTWHCVVALFVLGCGMGIASPVLTGLALRDVPPEQSGAGSGLVNAVIQFGSASGAAALGTLFFRLAEERDPVDAAGLTLLGNCAALVLAVLTAARLAARRRRASPAPASAHALFDPGTLGPDLPKPVNPLTTDPRRDER